MNVYKKRGVCRVQPIPEELKEKLQAFETPGSLVAVTGLSAKVAKKLLRDPDAQVTYATISRLYGILANHGTWAFSNNLKFIMKHPVSRVAYTKLVRSVATAVCVFADLANAHKRSAFAGAETHKPLFEAIAAAMRAGKCLWKVHMTWPEYDAVLFGGTDFIETWKELTGQKDRTVTRRAHSVEKTRWRPLMFFNEDPDLALFRAHRSDAGWDICLAEDEVTIDPQHSKTVRTGFHISMPMYHVGLIMSRSGLATKYGIEVGAGVIDHGYRGELKVLLHNHGQEPVTFHKGDRIAQLVVMRIFTGDCIRAGSFEELGPGDRNDNGFGSTGV